ncbi:hypothetical protein GPECTOR_20g468 [Gonium pectorale]|uniref:Uncharacterized protein n=1 Tax=Gonium pectorale TaxID=33097 RepID=A0A150GIH1_GONPE|nr:hypothetical protein GPECTOR_20g468 [Gonium pectorale]|eukprot:KXZ49612.1 hypothetical protein GPECTOR_20g468 [Gonium pectorale]
MSVPPPVLARCVLPTLPAHADGLSLGPECAVGVSFESLLANVRIGRTAYEGVFEDVTGVGRTVSNYFTRRADESSNKALTQ